MELTAALRQGLEQDQFLLHYQPIVDLATGHVTAMEALVRWQHPELGMLSPTEFIPVAEESGLIVPLGAWVLMQACTAMAGWSPTAGVSVNLSGVQLADPQVVVHVRDALRVSGLQPSRLVLEITESVVMQNSADNMRRLRALRDLGVRLAVDDFGTGYSSLAYLRAFPVDELKIDRSFVAAMGDDDDSLALVRTIVQLAESLSLQTVAEGVETAAQYDALQSLGCQRVQGYFISPPAPLADVASFAAAATPWHVAAALPWQR
jgi:EAL domain-containing protein (putative c-di-GMP-specific phosphodiesterase class I)